MFLILCVIRAATDLTFYLYYEAYYFDSEFSRVVDTISYLCTLGYFFIMVTEPFVWYKVFEFKDYML